MYRPLRIHVNSFVATLMAHLAGDFVPVKSMARSGGTTFRAKVARGAVFVLLEHSPDREEFSLSLAWNAQGISLPPEDAISPARIPSGADEQRGSIFELVQSCPAGELPVNQIGSRWRDWAIEACNPVPWKLVGEWVRSVDRAKALAALPVDDFTVESLARGDDPPVASANPAYGIKQPYPLQHPIVSWERWFEIMHQRTTSLAELDDITFAARKQSAEQLTEGLIPAAHCLLDAIDRTR
jgi:hypothetical protein